MANLKAQQVSGVRVYVTLCDSSSQALSNPEGTCDPTAGAVTGPNSTWTTNAAAFFYDVSMANIQYVTISTSPSSTTSYTLPASQTTSLNGPCSAGDCCTDTPSTVYFNPTVPFGLQESGNPIGDSGNTGSNQGYNCVPLNAQYFVGWTNLFNATGALLNAAQHPVDPITGSKAGSVIVNELEFGQEEINLYEFPAYYFYIYDASSGHATPPQTGPQSSPSYKA